MKARYDSLSPQECAWMVRCKVLVVLLFLGLLASIAFSDEESATRAYTGTGAANASAAAAGR